jgi:hypothetical protein
VVGDDRLNFALQKGETHMMLVVTLTPSQHRNYPMWQTGVGDPFPYHRLFGGRAIRLRLATVDTSLWQGGGGPSCTPFWMSGLFNKDRAHRPPGRASAILCSVALSGLCYRAPTPLR